MQMNKQKQQNYNMRQQLKQTTWEANDKCGKIIWQNSIAIPDQNYY